MSKFCVFLCFLCATTFDRRTKEHNASRPLRLCVKTNIYIFDIRTKVHIAPRPLCENKYVLMSLCLKTAKQILCQSVSSVWKQKYVLMFLCLKNCKANSVSFCAFRVQINFRALCEKTKICPYVLMSKKLRSKFCVFLCAPICHNFSPKNSQTPPPRVHFYTPLNINRLRGAKN